MECAPLCGPDWPRLVGLDRGAAKKNKRRNELKLIPRHSRILQTTQNIRRWCHVLREILSRIRQSLLCKTDISLLKVEPDLHKRYTSIFHNSLNLRSAPQLQYLHDRDIIHQYSQNSHKIIRIHFNFIINLLKFKTRELTFNYILDTINSLINFLNQLNIIKIFISKTILSKI